MDRCTCSRAESGRVATEPRVAQPEDQRLVSIENQPLIGETPQNSLQSWLTPNRLFYVRNHFSDPDIDEATWSLVVDGLVSRPLELRAADFRRMPKKTLPVTLECAGNNRSDLNPKVPGNPFQNGAISTAIWGGVPLSVVLEAAGVKPEGIEVLFEGMDAGKGEPNAEVLPYQRSLPLDVAMHPDTLLAFEMNGEPLPYEHGRPLRLVVPGWYGMASVKWLKRISAIDYEFQGFFQKDRYIIEEDDGEVVPVTRISVKSLISSPQPGEMLPLAECSVVGQAWAGPRAIRKVEFSDDGGQTWHEAQLVGPSYRYAWQQWNYLWKPRSPGEYALMARAEDEDGNVQPMKTRWNRLGYVINGVRPVNVTVRGS